MAVYNKADQLRVVDIDYICSTASEKNILLAGVEGVKQKWGINKRVDGEKGKKRREKRKQKDEFSPTRTRVTRAGLFGDKIREQKWRTDRNVSRWRSELSRGENSPYCNFLAKTRSLYTDQTEKLSSKGCIRMRLGIFDKCRFRKIQCVSVTWIFAVSLSMISLKIIFIRGGFERLENWGYFKAEAFRVLKS